MIFTQAKVGKLRAPAGKSDHIEWDEGMPGFGVRFRNGGAGTYLIQYSINGRQGRMGLGSVIKVTLQDAKTEAQQQFALIAKEVDPHGERARTAAKTGNKFGEKIELYFTHLESLGRSASYVGDHRRCLGRYMSRLHRYGLMEITRALIATELDKIEENSGRRQAGLARSYIHSFLTWAMQKGWVEVNVAMGTEKRNSKRRTRVLRPAELVAIWNATGGADHFDKIVRLLMLTAARKTQIGSLNRKTELNLARKLLDFEPPHVRAERGEDDADDGKTKNGERFWLALSNRAAAILETVPARNSSDFVFGHGEGGFSGWTSAKQRLDARLAGKIGDWTFHDFRRTFDSLGVDECKIAPWITDVCLNHVGEHKKGVKRTYNHATYIDEKRDAMARWADYIEALVAPVEHKIAA